MSPAMSEQKDLLTTTQKALTINLDVPKYGTFAEIGAGQEVAREFFQAGGASGTIAKSISAYDMVFSDAIYGKAPRYVSRERLKLMLDHEYQLLIDRLGEHPRRLTNRFFVLRTRSPRATTRARTRRTGGSASGSRPSPRASRARSCSTSGCGTRRRSSSSRRSGSSG